MLQVHPLGVHLTKDLATGLNEYFLSTSDLSKTKAERELEFASAVASAKGRHSKARSNMLRHPSNSTNAADSDPDGDADTLGDGGISDSSISVTSSAELGDSGTHLMPPSVMPLLAIRPRINRGLALHRNAASVDSSPVKGTPAPAQERVRPLKLGNPQPLRRLEKKRGVGGRRVCL